MSTDFIPDSIEGRHAWLVNLSVTFLANATSLNWGTGKVEEFEAFLNRLSASYARAIEADTAARQAKGDAKDLFSANVEQLRAYIAEIKTNSAFTEGMGEAMRIFTTGTHHPADGIKPSLKAMPERGQVVISGSKNYAETINIYMRRSGGPAGQWNVIAVKRKALPFEDKTPLAVPGVPEEREYMARGVIGDDEVGQDSDIVSVVFAG